MAGKIGKHATGRLGLYWGKTPDELRQAKSVPEAITLSWLELFQEKTPQILGLRLAAEKP